MSKTVNTSKQLQAIVVTALEDLKGLDIKVIPVGKLTSITDYMIVCTGTSNRHVKALANNVIKDVKTNSGKAKSEGEESGEWILIDAGDVVAHIMLPQTRDFYNLEGLWENNAA